MREEVVRINFTPRADPAVPVEEQRSLDVWAVFACPESWCRTETKMQVHRDALIVTGEAFLQCPRCFGSMKFLGEKKATLTLDAKATEGIEAARAGLLSPDELGNLILARTSK